MKKTYKIQVDLRSPLYVSPGNEEEQINVTAKKEVFYRANNAEIAEVPYIPASTIKGKLRDAFTKLINQAAERGIVKKRACNILQQDDDYCDCPACEIFGKKGYQPSRIFFEDLVPVSYEQDKLNYAMRPTVSVDRYRRVAKKGAFTKTVGVEKGCFEGKVEVYFSGRTVIYEQILMEAFSMIATIGGGKSRGFGFVKTKIEEEGGKKGG